MMMNNMRMRLPVRGKTQQGFILLTALAFMLVLTVILISMVTVSSSDEKIARNSRDKDLAFAAAEAALRDAELYVSGSYMWPYFSTPPSKNIGGFTNACPNALCDLRLVALTVPIEQLDFFNTDTRDGFDAAVQSNVIGTTTGSPTINGVINQPRYLIDIINYSGMACNNSPRIFRITAQAEGRSASTRVTLQQYYCDPNQ
jgi:type IV pilus assembly protein PilX